MIGWGVVAVLIVGTWVTRAGGLLLGDALTSSENVARALAWAPLAMIAALVVVGASATLPPGALLGPGTIGLAAGLVAASLRAPFLVTFLSVVVTTVLLRAFV